MSFYLVGLAAVSDFVDGLVARALNAVAHRQGPRFVGRYGFVWGGAGRNAVYAAPGLAGQSAARLAGLRGFIVTIFSALRLAKFNNDTRQTDSFIGLPTPACTLVVASLPLIMAHDTMVLRRLS